MSDVMSDEKWEEPYITVNKGLPTEAKVRDYVAAINKEAADDKKKEKEYLDKLVNDHWVYIEGILKVSGVIDVDIEMCKYHYITSAKHFWGHSREYHMGDTL